MTEKYLKEQIEADALEFEESIVKDIPLLGSVSKNGYEYLPEALRSGQKKIVGTPVYIDRDGLHSSNYQYPGPSDILGKVEEARLEKGQIRGDIRILSKYVEWFEDLRETFRTEGPGMSPIIKVAINKEGNVEDIIAFDRIDLVSKPATVKSLSESEKTEELEKEMENELKDKIEEIEKERDELREQILEDIWSDLEDKSENVRDTLGDCEFTPEQLKAIRTFAEDLTKNSQPEFVNPGEGTMDFLDQISK